MFRLIYHMHCFDGAASAAVLGRYLRERDPRADRIEYFPVTYTSRAEVDPRVFADGPEARNAIVDFKFSRDARVEWWFDHHPTTFASEEDARHFAENPCPRKRYDPTARSSAGLIARTLGDDFGWHAPDLDELVEWAELIDSAQLPDAKTAVELSHPALELGMVIRSEDDPAFVARIIDAMQSRPLAEVAGAPEVRERLKPRLEQHFSTLELLRSRARVSGDVLYFDLADTPGSSYDRFMPYYIAPEISYAVGVLDLPHAAKVTVGHNPWSRRPRRHHIGELCAERGRVFGGGGHAGIGAVSHPPGDIESARRTARQLVEDLGAPMPLAALKDF